MQKPPRSPNRDRRIANEALVDAAVAGVPTAICTLLRELSPEFTRVARTILGPNDMTLEDTIQDALVSFVQALPSFRGDCSIRRYANRIAARTALHARNRERATRQRESMFYLSACQGDYVDGRQELQHRCSAFVYHMFDKLPSAQGEVLALRFLFGYSLEEIAHAVDSPVNTVRSRIRMAREVMRLHLVSDPELFANLMAGKWVKQ